MRGGSIDHDHDHDHDHAGPGHLHAEFRFEVVGILAPTGGPHDRALFADITSSWILHAHDRRVKDGFETTTADDLTEA
ncbi:MAG: hypothetical protein KC457_37480, partial [Myxococcales bacterium]|nr:hypothetical protein [Myxococcales bacterium]